jgi:hypothetical protein
VKEHIFEDDLRNSLETASTERVKQIISGYFTQATSITCINSNINDGGTDYIATNESGFKARIDAKSHKNKEDDGTKILIEYFSNFENHKLGWTFDKTKNTEYILYYFENVNKWYFVDFPTLVNTAMINWRKWSYLGKGFGRAKNIGYTTVFNRIPLELFFEDYIRCCTGIDVIPTNFNAHIMHDYINKGVL